MKTDMNFKQFDRILATRILLMIEAEDPLFRFVINEVKISLMRAGYYQLRSEDAAGSGSKPMLTDMGRNFLQGNVGLMAENGLLGVYYLTLARRQIINNEKISAVQDLSLPAEDLAKAAACYDNPPGSWPWEAEFKKEFWPWPPESWNKNHYIRTMELIKAGQVIAAAIDFEILNAPGL